MYRSCLNIAHNVSTRHLSPNTHTHHSLHSNTVYKADPSEQLSPSAISHFITNTIPYKPPTHQHTFASRTHRAHHHRHCCSSKYKFMYTLALGYYVLHLNIFLWKYISVLCIYYYCTLSPGALWRTPAPRRPYRRERVRLPVYVLLIRPTITRLMCAHSPYAERVHTRWRTHSGPPVL